MFIIVITGSPHIKGTSALLADRFCAGAKEAGHEVTRFDAAFSRVAACLGCDHCRVEATRYQCVHTDAMENLNSHLLQSDLLVFVTPLYYFGMSAQLKTVIDRFYANNSRLQGGKKTILLATAADDQESTLDALVAHYQTMIGYMRWEDAGILLSLGVSTREDIEATDYPDQAWHLGRNLS
ncbi:MAG: flavodoxin family protein [Symbiobacteriaceae bacterium]|nr:flavodoxin family protein [Symbiobacteriaceae bacterium]